MTTVSVIIPTHNRPGACRRAVESALSQTLPPLEVIVCDDRSDERTAEMVRALSRRDERVRYLRRDAGPRGPGPTRNAGVAVARGDWVGFLDDDDAWLPHLLEREAAAADGLFDLVTANAYRKSGGLYFPDARESAVIERSDLLRANPVITSTTLVRRSLVEAAGGFPLESWLIAIEDYELWMRLADRGARMLFLGEPLAEYDDSGQVRLSAVPLRPQAALARLMVSRWLRRPQDRDLARAAMRETITAADFLVGTIGRRLRELRG